MRRAEGEPHDEMKRREWIRSESVSSLMLYLQEVFAVWMRDDVKTEALAAGECG